MIVDTFAGPHRTQRTQKEGRMIPGIHHGVPEDEYHSHPALSASAAKTLLHSPARYKWEQDHPKPATDAMDMGTLIHALVLRSGDKRLRVVDAYDWRSKAAQTARDDARAAGLIPYHRGHLRDAAKVAAAVRRHPIAGPLFRRGEGLPEVTLRWNDPETDVPLRGRIDWLTPRAIVDLKTVGRYGGAELGTFGRQAAQLDYPMSAANYVAGYAALTGDTLPFVTVAVEVEPPHFITVATYTERDLLAGHARMRAAIHVFKERTESGVWVDPPEVEEIPVPDWYARAYPQEF